MIAINVVSIPGQARAYHKFSKLIFHKTFPTVLPFTEQYRTNCFLWIASFKSERYNAILDYHFLYYPRIVTRSERFAYYLLTQDQRILQSTIRTLDREISRYMNRTIIFKQRQSLHVMQPALCYALSNVYHCVRPKH